MQKNIWEFYVDRGGTFTDIIAKSPKNTFHIHKLLSSDQAPVQGIRHILQLPPSQPIPPCIVRMGTTIGTNALLERKGAPTCLVITKGFRHLLEIGYQTRKELFSLDIEKHPTLYECSIEIDERVDASGKVIKPLEEEEVWRKLHSVKAANIRSLAIVFMHSYLFPHHELKVKEIAKELGFTCISCSCEVSPQIKIIPRADTTVLNAYLAPTIQNYTSSLQHSFPQASVSLMQSSGGLVSAQKFQGKDSLLSGPAGGVVAVAEISKSLGFPKVIGFDMGGTSTDVSRFDGEYEMTYESEKAGLFLKTPMLHIETVAAGGGSIIHFDGMKLQVGPQSAGANPGPICYGKGGQHPTLTDANLLLGRIDPKYFPAFPLQKQPVQEAFANLAKEIQQSTQRPITAEQVALGAIEVANNHMAEAIKVISVSRGYDPREYALCAFGGAAGQHICAIARLLRIPKIIIHPFASLFSALGMGLADVQLHREYHFQEIITPSQWKEVQTKIEKIFEDLQKKLDKELQVYTNLQKKIFQPYLDLRYQGQATEITIPYRKDKSPIPLFEEYHKRKFGHLHPARPIELVALRLKAIGKNPLPPLPTLSSSHHAPQPCDYTQIFFVDRFQKSPIFLWEHLRAKQKLQGPALILNPHLSIVIEPDFKAEVLENGSLLLTSTQISTPSYAPQKDPIQLEIFSKLFSSIAEQMGQSLQQSAFSTNIKERLDFSCAIFNKKGELIANAAHIPVHLGAMEETVKYLLQTQPHLRPGDTYITNHPFQGGSHLPDITAITPVFHNKKLAFFVANRGHHADIGGIVPGSMPAFSTSLQEEGVLIENFKLIDQGKPRYEALQQLLTQAPYPVRDLNERISDLEAQVSANTKGVHLLQEAVQKYGENILQNYMSYIQEAAEQKVRKLLLTYPNGNYFFEDKMDNGLKISVHIHIKEDEAIIDFSGTSPQDEHSNLNANTAITKAAILYVFRTLLQEDIPLNSGCLRPLQIHIPLGCFLNPTKEVAVVGGNVETSQRICDALLGALQATAASQGTMNNLSFGNKTFGYYETIAGGTGATPRQNGVDAVQSNMTNTRCTDPEIFESRYPARIERIHIRNNSGGQGKYRGGNGIIKRIRFSQSLTVSFLTSRRRIPPYGMQGGESGKAGLNLWIKQKKSKTILQPLPPTCTIEVQPQDAIEIHTPGGGGWQSPPPPPSVEELNQKIEKIPPNSLQNRRKIQKLVHQIRLHIRTNLWQKPTAGLAPNCIQANLIAIPQVYANEFLDYCQQNPRPCPLLEWLPAGEFRPHLFAPLGDIRTDVPLYNVHFHHKNFTAPSILPYWDDSISTFLLGCSFSFERALIQAGILLRHIQEKKNVAMYITNIPTQAAGRFKGNLVVSMRPIPKNQVEAAIDITQKFPFGHGEPIHIGNPKEIGISNLNQVDFGDAVEVQPDEVPVFWACGVSALLAVKNSKIPLYFTHSPGCMFLTDVLPTLE